MLLREKMNVTRSLLDDVKKKQSNGTDSPKDGGGETAKRGTGMATVRGKEKRQTETYLGGGDWRNDGRKGVTGRGLG
jgi:hypothetical protein